MPPPQDRWGQMPLAPHQGVLSQGLGSDRFWRGLWDYGSVEGNGNSGQSWDPGAVSSVEENFD